MNAVEVDLDAVERAISGYQSVIEDLLALHQDIRFLTQIRPPGDDAPSRVYAHDANERGLTLLEANTALSDTIRARIDKLTAVVAQYRGSEHGNALILGGKG
ncbi:hypothetical protein [Actinosynnema sp. NPDC020468]|uniref:hypothetical protein n=1 Tax=Actinosynnema sp. NPDC020468 TaxID=3154488 RepID=UPI0033D66AB7